VLIVTRKAASPERAHEVRDAVTRAAPSTPVAIAYLAASGLRRADADETRRLADLRGQRVRLVAAIGDPRALIGQLAAAGAVVDARIFSDHHPYTDRDIAQLATGADADTTVVCTLKDAVKIAPRWPRAAPALWYVSQRVIIEDGLEHLSRSIRNLLDARSSDPEAAGGRRPSL
jgi:tetraacyldisaccharide 4'-kinase